MISFAILSPCYNEEEVLESSTERLKGILGVIGTYIGYLYIE